MVGRYIRRRGASSWAKFLAYMRISESRRRRGLGVRWRKSFKRRPFMVEIASFPRRPDGDLAYSPDGWRDA